MSLLNMQMAEAINEIVRIVDAGNVDRKDFVPAMSEEQTKAIIHAALWARGCRLNSFASCYAMTNLFNALELETWTFKPPAPPTSPHSEPER